MPKESTKISAVRLPAALDRRLTRLAKATHRTKTYYIREAIQEHIDDLEDCYLALQRMEQGLPGIPLDEAKRELLGDDG